MRALPLVIALCLVTGCEPVVRTKPQVDAGPICEGNERVVNGTCRFVCTRDGDCPSGQRCDLLVGTCAPKPPPVDAGETRIPCTEGAVRCSADNIAVQTCGDAGVFTTSDQCVQPDGFCQNERCLVCRPGARRCTASGAEICRDDGSGYRAITCAVGATCVGGECAECTVGQRRCSPNNTTLQECQRLPREDLSAGYVAAGDNFDGTCVTQVCEQGASGAQCRAPACLPGAQRCASTSTQQVCSVTGAWTDVTCSTLPNLGPTAECLNGACVDECTEAARANSYFGCEYWTTVMENGLTPSIFKGNLSGVGLGTADSEFAFVVSNRSVQPTTVTIRRWNNNAEQVVKTVLVPGRTDPATKGVAQIKVPWHHVAVPAGTLGTTGRGRVAYRLTASRPVTVYQFNPLSAVGLGGTCNSVNQCNLEPSGSGQTCTAGRCNYFSFSNDASLLLPAHILGTSYVGMTVEHLALRPTTTGAPQNFSNGTLSIVASQDGTDVTVRASARTLASTTGMTAVTAMSMGETRTFSLSSYEVLQLTTDLPAILVSGSSAGNLQCGNNPYDRTFACSLGNCSQVCRVAGGDLTGSIVTSTKPIAVFGGSACALRGFLDTACDHVEEQLFPFVTWGKNFVGARTAPLRLTNNQFATAANAGPDYYKVVAGCPDTAVGTPCPNGTSITLSVPPAAGDVLSNAGGCAAGTSLTANNCRLLGGRFVEFRSKTSFTITASQPVQVAQIFAGQDATTGTTRPSQGDPSLVLLPPVEQWRSSYTVLTAPGTRDNYLGIVIDGARVAEVRVDGVAVSSWTNIASSNFRVANVPVLVGSHAIEVLPVPNQTQLPGAGVTVYGFDSYVSYGYTGGLDLTTIVTGINPGG